MTILISSASYVFSDHVPGGEFQVAYDLVKRLALRGHRIHVLAPTVRLNQELRGVIPREIGPYDLLDRTRYATYQWRYWRFTWNSYRAAKAIASRESVDVVHHIRPAFPGRFSLCWRLDIPFVYGPMSLPVAPSLPDGVKDGGLVKTDFRDRIEGKMADRLNMTLGGFLWKKTMESAASIPVSVSLTRSFLPPTCVDRSPLIPLGVDTQVFKPGGHGDSNTVLYAGNLFRSKGLQYLIEAMPQLVRFIPGAQLIVAGDGPDRAFFHSLTEKLGVSDRIRFLGAIPFDRMPPLYQSCSVFCLPTLAEAFGVSLLQAMASGKPVVASRVGGVPHFVEDGRSGILVAPMNPEELAEAIQTLLSDPTRCQETGEYNRRLCEERYDWDVVVDQIEGIYRSVVS